MPPMQRVRVTLKGQVVTEVDVDRDLTIGRKAPADIVVVDTEISGRHVKLSPGGDGILVTDLGSTNGSTIDDGARLAPNTAVSLVLGQKLKIGAAVVEIVGSAEPERPESSSGFASTEKTVQIGGGAMQSVLVNIARFKAAQPRLVVAAEHDRRVIPIESMDVVVGRDGKHAQIVVQHQSVSSAHAKIRYENGRFLVEDLKSSNGTFLDGNPVAVATPIQGEQVLTFGTVDCLFVQKAAESGAGPTLDPHAEALCAHTVRLGKATHQQAKEVLAEHRSSGTSLGQLFVGKGMVPAKEWSEIYRQRQIISTLAPLAAKGGASVSKIVGIVVVILGLAAVAAFFLLKF